MGKQALPNDVGVHSSNEEKTNMDKLITRKEKIEILAKARAEGFVKKKGSIPKYPPEMDLAPSPPNYRQSKLQSYLGT